MSPSEPSKDDLYGSVVAVLAEHADSDRALEVFLCALHGGLSKYAQAPGVSADEFIAAVAAAFEAEPASAPDTPSDPEATGYAAFVATLGAQVRDLRAMRAGGTFEDDHRYYGVDARSGARWYNFDPRSYVECGAQGALRRREPSDGARTLGWDALRQFLICGRSFE